MYFIGNGKLLTRNPSLPFTDDGGVITDGEKIVEIGKTEFLKRKYPQAEFIDAERGVIMPGLINLSVRMNASLIRAFPFPAETDKSSAYNARRSFREKFNALLTLKASKLSAMAAAINCIKHGVTTVFDYYAASSEPAGSLLSVSSVVREAGIRACLCYGVSDEYGRTHCDGAITENTEFIEYAETLKSNSLKAVFGLGSPSALSNTSLKKCAARNKMGVGFYVNFSGNYGELYDSLRKFGIRPIKRLYSEGILGKKTVLSGCADINENEAEIINKADTAVVIKPEKLLCDNSDFAKLKPVFKKKCLIGTSGGTDDMLNGLRASAILFRDDSDGFINAVSSAAETLFKGNPEIASRIFNIDLGILAPGAAADIIVMDYRPFTPITARNADAHIIYGMSGKDCQLTMTGGRILMRNRKIMFVDEDMINRETVDFAKLFWKNLM